MYVHIWTRRIDDDDDDDDDDDGDHGDDDMYAYTR